MTAMLKLADLHPHPGNPRLAPRADVVEQIAAQLNGKLDEAHALIVRPNASGFEIISGHHRALAAKQAGLSEVPCWVREMSDEDAYMALALNNAQGELHPLERGLHALGVVEPSKPGRSVKAYAERVGRAKEVRNVQREIDAAEVAREVGDIANLPPYVSHLAEIHAAPRWAWSALVSAMLDKGWSVEQTRKQTARFKASKEPVPAWIDLEQVAAIILQGRPNPVDEMRASYAEAVDDLQRNVHRAAPIRRRLDAALAGQKLAAVSGLQAVIRPFLRLQANLKERLRDRQEQARRAREAREEQEARLRRNVSLAEWDDLDAAVRESLLTIGRNTLFGFTTAEADTSTFNKQESQDIEWAQWSWNPITGCKHDCPYCYAREIALSLQTRMGQEGPYPHGFEPVLRPAHLAAPHATKVPQEASKDVRYRNVFTGSMADMWGRWVPAEWIEAVLFEIAAAKQWNFLTLTKFPGRMAEFSYTPNVWLGTTVDMQARVAAAEKAFAKVECDGKKWLSIEPMLEPLTFTRLDLFDFIVVGGATPVSLPKKTPGWKPPVRWIVDLAVQWIEAKGSLDGFYAKSNLLGSTCREGLLSLGSDVLVTPEKADLPDALRYAAMTMADDGERPARRKRASAA